MAFEHEAAEFQHHPDIEDERDRLGENPHVEIGGGLRGDAQRPNPVDDPEQQVAKQETIAEVKLCAEQLEGGKGRGYEGRGLQVYERMAGHLGAHPEWNLNTWPCARTHFLRGLPYPGAWFALG